MLEKLSIKAAARICARLLITVNIAIMIILRYNLPIVAFNEKLQTQRWIKSIYRMISKDYQSYFPSALWSMQNYSYFVDAFQLFDWILVVLILCGTKLGIKLLLIEKCMLLILKCLVVRPSIELFFNNVGDSSMNFFRQIGVIGACLALI